MAHRSLILKLLHSRLPVGRGSDFFDQIQVGGIVNVHIGVDLAVVGTINIV